MKTALFFIVLAVFCLALFIYIGYRIHADNLSHIERVSEGQQAPDDWFLDLLDDKEYLEHYQECLGMDKRTFDNAPGIVRLRPQ